MSKTNEDTDATKERRVLDMGIKPFEMIPAEPVESLLLEYGLPLEAEKREKSKFEIEGFGRGHIGRLRLGISPKPDNTIIQVAKLAMLMNSCDSGRLEFKCTISNNNNGFIKGTQEKVEIENEDFNFLFTRFLHTLISYAQGDIYEHYLCPNGQNSKRSYKFGIFRFTEDWTQDELKTIIQYEQARIERHLSDSVLIGEWLKNKLTQMNQYNLFAGCTQTKIYSFLYDLGVLHGIFNDNGKGFTGTIGREKFAEIRNRINAYEKKMTDLGLKKSGARPFKRIKK